MKKYVVRVKLASGRIIFADIVTCGDVYEAVEWKYPNSSIIGADGIIRIG